MEQFRGVGPVQEVGLADRELDLWTGPLLPEPGPAERAYAEALRVEREALEGGPVAPWLVPDSLEAHDAWDDALSVLAAESTEAERPLTPGGRLVEGLARTGDRISDVTGGLAQDGTARVQQSELVTGLQALTGVLVQGQAGLFTLLREAAARKLHTDAGMGLSDWVNHTCPGLPPTLVSDLAVVATHGHHPGITGVADALAAGTLAAHRAAKVTRVLDRTRRAVPTDQQQAYGQIALDAALDADISDRDLTQVCRKLLEDLLADTDKEEQHRKAQQLRCASSRPLGDGMRRYTIDAPEADAAVLESIFASPLAAPAPEPDGTPDGRSAGQRRYDAIRTVINRGLGNPGAAPSQARASLIITMRVDPHTGQPTGPARTMTGQFLSRSEVELLSCGQVVTPIWFSPAGEPLALGRTKRLATPGQFLTLYARDGHCTWPGCTIPGSWCDAHHLIWWSRHGNTDVAEMALLCPRHHTLVHHKDLTATITGGTITWHT